MLSVLKQYNPEIQDDNGTNSFWTQRGYHASLLEGFVRECEAQKDFQLLEIVRRYIKIDFYYYTLLKKLYKENFV